MAAAAAGASTTEGRFRYRRPMKEVGELMHAQNRGAEFKALLDESTPPEERMAIIQSVEQLGGFFVEKVDTLSPLPRTPTHIRAPTHTRAPTIQLAV